MIWGTRKGFLIQKMEHFQKIRAPKGPNLKKKEGKFDICKHLHHQLCPCEKHLHYKIALHLQL